LAQSCPPGQVWIGKFVQECVPCSPGYYCINSRAYKCPPGTYQPKRGQTSCGACSKQSSPDRTVCLLDDAPADIEGLNQDYHYKILVLLNREGIVHVLLGPWNQNYTNYIDISVEDQNPGQTTLYISNVTGIPSEKNHTVKASGSNITMLLEPTNQKELLYATLEISKFTKTMLVITTEYTTVQKVRFNPGQTEAKVIFPDESGLTYNSPILFTIPVKSKSRVTLVVPLKSDKHSPFGWLYWSGDKTNQLPNRLNYQESSGGDIKSGEISISVVDEGDVSISLFTSYKYADTIAHVIIEPL